MILFNLFIKKTNVQKLWDLCEQLTSIEFEISTMKVLSTVNLGPNNNQVLLHERNRDTGRLSSVVSADLSNGQFSPERGESPPPPSHTCDVLGSPIPRTDKQTENSTFSHH